VVCDQRSDLCNRGFEEERTGMSQIGACLWGWLFAISATTLVAFYGRCGASLTIVVVAAYWVNATIFRPALRKSLTGGFNQGETNVRMTRRWLFASVPLGVRGAALIAVIGVGYLLQGEVLPQHSALSRIEALRRQVQAPTILDSKGVHSNRPTASTIVSDIELLLHSDLPKGAQIILRHDAGVYFYATGDLDRAMELFQQVIEWDVTNADSHFNIGRILQRRGEHEDAIRAFELARKYDADNADATYWIGVSRHLLGKPELARAAFLEARDKFPNDSKWRTKCEEFLRRMDESPE